MQSVALEQVMLLGTTKGTTWRARLIDELVSRGVDPSRIINPHLPGGGWTAEHAEAERLAKADPSVMLVIYVTPAVIDQSKYDAATAADLAERVGPMTMFEAGLYAGTQPDRTAVLFDIEAFAEGKRPRKVLSYIRDEIRSLTSDPTASPYMASWEQLVDWVAEELYGLPPLTTA
jgi:hypothetical protein